MQTNSVNGLSISKIPSAVATSLTSNVLANGNGINGTFNLLLDALQSTQTLEPKEAPSTSHGQPLADDGNGIADRGTLEREHTHSEPSGDTPTRGTDSHEPTRTDRFDSRDEMDTEIEPDQTDRSDLIETNVLIGDGTSVPITAPTAHASDGSPTGEPTASNPTAPTPEATVPASNDAPRPAPEQPTPGNQPGTHAPRVTEVTPESMPKQMPEQAMQGLAQAGKEAPPSPAAGRPVDLPNAKTADGGNPGQSVAALAKEGSTDSSQSNGTPGNPSHANPNAADPQAGSKPSPAAMLAANDQASFKVVTAGADVSAPGTNGLITGSNGLATAVHAATETANAKAAALPVQGESASAGAKTVDAVFGSRQAEASRTAAPLARPEARSSAHQANRSELIDRITKSIRLSQQEGTSRMRMVLRPQELGTLKVNLTVKDGVLTAVLQTETAAAKHLIAGNLHELRASLAQQGITVDSFEVIYQEDSGASGFDHSTGERFGQSESEPASSDASSTEDGAEESRDPMAEKQRLMADSATVDILV